MSESTGSATHAWWVLSLVAFVLLLPSSASSRPVPAITPLSGEEGLLEAHELPDLLAKASRARIVALGESTHASGGFSRAKTRLIRTLVEIHGFRRIAWENPRTPMESARRFIANCSGNSTKALSGLLPVWRNREVADLLVWLCQFNQRHPGDPVSLVGMDAQEETFSALSALETALPGHKSGNASLLLAHLRHCFGFGMNAGALDRASREIFEGRARISDADHASCSKGLAAVRASLPAARSWIARIALESIRAYQTEHFFWSRDLGKTFTARDRGMAGLFALMDEQAGHPRTILWAHNEHLARDRSRIESSLYRGAPGMGTFLRRRYGRNYFPIALAGYHVHVRWPGEDPKELELPGSGDSLEGRLHSSGVSQAWLDLGIPSPFAREWIRLGGELMMPAEQFQAVLFLDRSPAME